MSDLLAHTTFGIAVAMLTGRQLRAARALLNWSRKRLADESDVPAVTIQGFEAGANSKLDTVIRLRRACELAGVAFIDAEHGGVGEGVRVGTGLKEPEKSKKETRRRRRLPRSKR
jgi:transcriptional regulator with XRE-family HTH domain